MRIKPEIYDINGHDVSLFTIGRVSRMFGFSNEAIRKKEERGMIPPAKFRGDRGVRLYSVDELALFEYIFKEVWPRRRGARVPEWVKDISMTVFSIAQKEVLTHGKVMSEDAFSAVHKKHKAHFSKFKAMMYIKHYRSVLLDEEEEYLELDDEF